MLKHPDLEQAFVVQADASDVAVAIVLLQVGEQGALQPCMYTFYKLTKAKQWWATWGKEALAIWWALMTWHYLLEGSNVPFEVRNGS